MFEEFMSSIDILEQNSYSDEISVFINLMMDIINPFDINEKYMNELKSK